MPRIKDLIRKSLDKELNTREGEKLNEICQKDPGVLKEIEELHGTVNSLRCLEKGAPPGDFVTQVMQSLADQIPPTWTETVAKVLFSPHWIRWNLASAMACGLVAIISLTLLWPRMRSWVHPEMDEKKIYLVRFILHAPHADNVYLVGDFNNWEQNNLPLTDKEGNGLWTITLSLNPGIYNYMFFVNGKEWVSDPHADYYCDDGFGHKNAILKIRDS